LSCPNHLHREYTVRAARADIQVLREKPMAVTKEECEEMIRVTQEHRVKLMSGKLGDSRLFNSVFTMQVEPGNIRLQKGAGGGTLFDIAIYGINAAHYLFREEPIQVFAQTANNGARIPSSGYQEVDSRSC
jgi:predicted dehydrogenase